MNPSNEHSAIRNSSVSPSRHSLPQQMAAIGARISRGLSLSRDGSRDSEYKSIDTDGMPRSLSRGRDGYKSSGRGGYGNIHRPSSKEPVEVDGPDDFSTTRGRELAVDSNKVISTGRGGVGNIRSPSRGVHPSQGDIDHDNDVLKQHAVAEKTAIHSSGRGGIGNINRSRSRGGPQQGLSS